MCGIAGIVHRGALADAPARASRMADSIRHRGPDDEGYWSDSDIALGFVRLSIIDLKGGYQPMANEDERVWVVFNGEIYNHIELRRELQRRGHRFRSDHSDTEVLVHGWEEWGVELPARLNGMFAFAIWDCRDRTLFLARDRYGIKPLYTAMTGDGTLIFASEIRAIHASELVERREDCDGILEYLSQQNTWGPRTLFADVEEFPAAHWERRGPSVVERRRYWDYDFARGGRRMSLAGAAEQHRAILEKVIARQIVADVPVMSYLSGGIDSSAIAAAAFQRDPGMRAYSCIFELDGVGDDRIVDEREFSRAVAAHLGIEHVQLELPQDALTQAIEHTVNALETPRMGMSYVNDLIAARVARDSKVVLSGTGGDELHGGYVYRYGAVQSAHRPAAPPWLSPRFWVDRLRGVHRQPAVPNQDSIYLQMLNFPIPANRIDEALTPEFLRRAGSYRPREALAARLNDCPYRDPWDRVMYIDAHTYLHGLLVLEDKLSMAHSLEARVPLLDNELVDFVTRLPWRYLYDGKTGKIVFRESVRPLVPDAIYRKPKMGFGPPDASWYRGALRPFVEDQLRESIVSRRGVFRPDFVRGVLDDHFSGRANNVAVIWSLLTFESWCRSFGMFGGRIH